MIPVPEFSRPAKLDTLGGMPTALSIEANEAERAALAKRFDLPGIDALSANAELVREGEIVTVRGRLQARVTQSCVASGEPVPASLDEPFAVEFRPLASAAATTGEEEIELSAADCDVMFYERGEVDVGEAVAETLSLSLDPYPRAPGAEEILRAKGVLSEEEATAARAARSPFAALKDKADK